MFAILDLIFPSNIASCGRQMLSLAGQAKDYLLIKKSDNELQKNPLKHTMFASLTSANLTPYFRAFCLRWMQHSE